MTNAVPAPLRNVSRRRARPAHLLEPRKRRLLSWETAPGNGIDAVMLGAIALTMPTLHMLRYTVAGAELSAPVFIAALYVWWALVRPGARTRAGRVPRSTPRLALVLALWLALSMLWSREPQWAKLGVVLINMLIAIVLLVLAKFTSRTWDRVTTILALSTFAAVLFGLYKVAFAGFPWFQFSDYRSTNLGTRNSDAYLVALVFPLALVRILVYRTKAARLGWALASVCSAVAVFLSLSRGQLIAMGVGGAGVAFYFVPARAVAPLRRGFGRLFRALVVVSLVLLALGVTEFAFQGHETAIGRLASAGQSERLPLADEAFSTAISHPVLGIGFDSFRLSNPLREDAHNAYLNLSAESGLLGLLLYVMLLVVPLKEYWVVLNRLRSGQATGVSVRGVRAILGGAGMTITLAASSFFQTYYKTTDFWLMYLLAILPLRLVCPDRTGSFSAREVSTR